MSWEGPDKYRDEDICSRDEAICRPEIGSEAWVRAEIAAPRPGEEHDVYARCLHAQLWVASRRISMLVADE